MGTSKIDKAAGVFTGSPTGSQDEDKMLPQTEDEVQARKRRQKREAAAKKGARRAGRGQYRQ